jgi:cAMP-dependent protein kinase regulator
MIKDYSTSKLNPFLTEIVSLVLSQKPEKPLNFLKTWLEGKLGKTGQLSEKEELLKLRQEVARLKHEGSQGSEDESSDSADEQDDQIDDLPQSTQPAVRHRSGVSAEAYGNWNKKESFHPRVVQKTQEAEERISERMETCVIFKNVQGPEKSIIIHSMEEKIVKSGQVVIQEGDDGNELYLVDSGKFDCFKKIGEENKKIKEYHSGEVFGELALLYNAPRAATIVAVQDSVLWSLDRECFNHIVKEAAIRRREKYVKFLSQVKILSNMDPYERSQLADVLKTLKFSPGEVIIKQGDNGDDFFIVEEGNAVATKVIHQGQHPEEVMKYGPGDYFGELALIKGEPRAANVQAVSHVQCLCLDRHSFKRLLGNLEDILKRNARHYEEVVAKLMN